jgi:hypothetical protein
LRKALLLLDKVLGNPNESSICSMSKLFDFINQQEKLQPVPLNKRMKNEVTDMKIMNDYL